MTEAKTDYSRGLVICLVKFTNHFSNSTAVNIRHINLYLSKTEAERKQMISMNPPPNLNYGKDVNNYLRYFSECVVEIFDGSFDKAVSHEITLWASGASDHLYDIEVPEGDKWNDVRKMVEELKEKGLSMGHSFNDNKLYKIEDFDYLIDLTLKISLEIDKSLGLKADIGTWA